jgi:hypothetical protein
MKTDALDRRLRFAAPQPRVGRIVLTDADYLIFEAIDRHGPLPSHYLYEVAKHLRKDKSHLQNRLTEFYNGDAFGPYLIRPPQQFAGFEARYQHIVYDLAPRARQALSERGTLGLHSPRRTDPFLHQLMAACVGMSLELTAQKEGLRYIPREEILNHPKCPAVTRASKNPMALQLPGAGGHQLVPDDLFGIEYPGVGFRFFAVEIDRNTESIERRNLDSNTFGRKIAGYLTVLGQRLYQAHWGLPNLTVLTVTTNATHARNILDYIERLKEPRYADRFGFAYDPSFGANWRVPKVLLSHLLDEPWVTVSGTKDIDTPE